MKEARSPCLTCEHREEDKNCGRCINCERRIAYAEEEHMISGDSKTTTVEISGNNQLIDLNNLLFAEMGRLSNEALKDDALREEIERAKSMSNVATQIINNASLALKGQIAINDGRIRRAPKMLGLVSGVEGDDE